jgi:aryl-alcohol dehydrogenase-like predicted oxidoreductase
MSAEVLASPPPGWPEWVVATKSSSPEWVVATKFGQLHGVKTNAVRRAVDDSLRRLQTDRIDMYYAHVDDGLFSLLEREARGSAVIESLDAVHLRLSDDEVWRLTDAGALTAVSNSDTQPVG